ncbi:multiprotein-bridging factor 1 family protein [Chitinophaga sp. GCM10012297]|uniref:Helix-turn-helix transcriptional regulator n=1 Tax=Chitinophaga chungangae TaxID=2821488 RepID=A0ABS3YK21_9BACT|nr:helix-turn-helix transcriptional regulator [Chitinophaga chungangae]MBO9155041.1 helix-turn-helix transcriptional regulator [Chitinophaga chungangae]
MKTKFDKIAERIPAHTRLMVSKWFDITERILEILTEKGMTQKDLADLLGKNESEISKWMKGAHNFTLDTIAKIEIALGETILSSPNARKKEFIVGEARVLKEVFIDPTSGGTAAQTLDNQVTISIKQELSF